MRLIIPEDKRAPVLGKNEKACCGCGACASICPTKCIAMEKNMEGFSYPYIRIDECIHCHKCKSVCPILKTKDDKAIPIQSWAAISTDKEIQRSSSSGGIFTLLAEDILNEGGCIYGATFTDDFQQVYHTRIDDINDLYVLRTSKYLQSRTEGVFEDVEAQLKTGRAVLFSGTPCQIAGLKAFLRAEYCNLISVAIICHGVPSPKLWEKYIEQISRKYRGTISSVNFRNKKYGWKKYGLQIKYKGKEYYRKLAVDPYMQMFLRNICLRESCYLCNAKDNGPEADITIGDFWGVETIVPEMNNIMGTSLVLLHSEKGRKLFEKREAFMKCKQVDFDEAIKQNTSYFCSVKRPESRNWFYKDLEELPWKKFVNKYGRLSFRKRIKKTVVKLYKYSHMFICDRKSRRKI